MVKLQNLKFSNPRLLGAVCFLIVIGIQISLAFRDAQTSDEGVHLVAGYSYVTENDYRLNPEHPPLVKILAGLPLLGTAVQLPSDYASMWHTAGDYYRDTWEVNRQLAQKLLFASGNNPDLLLFLGRLGPILLFAALLIIIFVITKRYYGEWAGLVASLSVGFNPTFLAHGHLITTDIAASLATMLTAWALWHYSQKATTMTAVWLGLALGFGLISKFTMILLVPIVTGWIVCLGVKKAISWRHIAKHSVIILFIAYLVILLAYFGQWRPAGLLEPRPYTNFGWMGDLIQWFIPRDFIKGLLLVLSHTQYGHTSYLLGQFSNTGWWYYFPMVILIKTPLTILGLIAASGIWLITRKKRDFATFCAVVGLILLGLSMFSKANLGIRHVAPIFPLLAVGMGALFSQSSLRHKQVIVGFCFILFIESVWTYPHYISYINPAFGGSANGPHLIGDSNVDWGQDLKAIKNYVETHEVGQPYIDYTWAGDAALDYYQIPHRLLVNSTNDPTGYIIVSSSVIEYPDFRWLGETQFIKRLTPSVWIYKFND